MAERGAIATPEQVALWLQVSVKRLAYLREKKRGPKYIKEGRIIRYVWADVHAWCNQNRQGTADA